MEIDFGDGARGIQERVWGEKEEDGLVVLDVCGVKSGKIALWYSVPVCSSTPRHPKRILGKSRQKFSIMQLGESRKEALKRGVLDRTVAPSHLRLCT